VPSGANVRVDRIWNRVSDENMPVIVSGWLMTSPADEVQGALLSERLVWHRTPDSYDPETRIPGGLLMRGRTDTTWPPDLAMPVADLIPSPHWLAKHRLGWQLNALGRGHHPLPKDETHLRAFEKLFEPLGARFGAVYWMGIDQLSHLYWPFVVPEAVNAMRRDPTVRQRDYQRHPASKAGKDHKYFPWVDAPMTPEQLAEGRRWIEDAYAAADDALARVMDQVDPTTTTLFVLADHGFQGGRTMASLDARHRDVGFLAGWGRRVKHSDSVAQPNILDLTPTFCALLGVEAARDMPGRALTDLFDIGLPKRDDSWIRPVSIRPGEQEPVPPELDEQLRALGYVE
jgi:hypothetical protein